MEFQWPERSIEAVVFSFPGCLADGVPDGGSWPYWGASLVALELVEAQTGAKAFDIPLRLPGQYFDAETGKHENHNRFYDAESSRYLTPEPMLEVPWWVLSEAQQGYSTPTYAYARNNPLRFIDPTGLAPPELPCSLGDSTYSCCIKRNLRNPENCGGGSGTGDPITNCARAALAAYDACIERGTSIADCMEAMTIVYNNCIKRRRVPVVCLPPGSSGGLAGSANSGGPGGGGFVGAMGSGGVAGGLSAP